MARRAFYEKQRSFRPEPYIVVKIPYDVEMDLYDDASQFELLPDADGRRHFAGAVLITGRFEHVEVLCQ